MWNCSQGIRWTVFSATVFKSIRSPISATGEICDDDSESIPPHAQNSFLILFYEKVVHKGRLQYSNPRVGCFQDSTSPLDTNSLRDLARAIRVRILDRHVRMYLTRHNSHMLSSEKYFENSKTRSTIHMIRGSDEGAGIG